MGEGRSGVAIALLPGAYLAHHASNMANLGASLSLACPFQHSELRKAGFTKRVLHVFLLELLHFLSRALWKPLSLNFCQTVHNRSESMSEALPSHIRTTSKPHLNHIQNNGRSSAIHLWGRSGRGHCRKISANFRKMSATFRRISAPFPDAIKRIFCRFPRTFRGLSSKKPFANDPISELLRS